MWAIILAILLSHGVQPEAADYIGSHAVYEVKAGLEWNGQPVGGLWWVEKGLVELDSLSPEIIIHESAHVYWDWLKLSKPSEVRAFYFQVEIYALVDAGQTTEFKAFARSMLSEHRNEWFASLASWMMGQYRAGERMVPESMWWILGEFFIGDLETTPYYEAWFPNG